jgi:hypothetical protein
MELSTISAKILNAQFRIQNGSRESDLLHKKVKEWIKERTNIRQNEIDNCRKKRSDRKR